MKYHRRTRTYLLKAVWYAVAAVLKRDLKCSRQCFTRYCVDVLYGHCTSSAYTRLPILDMPYCSIIKAWATSDNASIYPFVTRSQVGVDAGPASLCESQRVSRWTDPCEPLTICQKRKFVTIRPGVTTCGVFFCCDTVNMFFCTVGQAQDLCVNKQISSVKWANHRNAPGWERGSWEDQWSVVWRKGETGGAISDSCMKPTSDGSVCALAVKQWETLACHKLGL